MNKFNINDHVMTPDGEGIVKRIQELYSGEIGYDCVLKEPYRVTDPYRGTREYGFHPYAFGYTYRESKLTKEDI